MLEKLKSKMMKNRNILYTWGIKHFLGLIVFNMIMLLLVLLHTAGYFNPYYEITINFIVFFALVLSIFLLGAKSNSIFLAAVIFWSIALFFKVFGVNIWSERAAIYAFQALFVGVLLLFFEEIKASRKK